MSEIDGREQNLYFQMESVNQRDVRIYDEVVCESQTPATEQTGDKFPHGTEEETRSPTQHKNARGQSQAVIIKRVVFKNLDTATIITFLVAVAALVLAVTTMVTRNNQSPSKDCAAGKSPMMICKLCNTNSL